MKYKVLFFISFFMLLALAVLVLFFLNKFLFLIHGFDMNSTKNTTAETFKAYKTIYKSKLLVMVLGLILSIVSLLFARKISVQNPCWKYHFLYIICWLFTLIFTLLNVFLFVLPKGPLV